MSITITVVRNEPGFQATRSDRPDLPAQETDPRIAIGNLFLDGQVGSIAISHSMTEAHVVGDPTIWAAGATAGGSIGNLLLTHRDKFGLTFVLPPEIAGGLL